MKKYVCSQCGQPWFSAAELKDLKAKKCERCDGELVETGERDLRFKTLPAEREGKK